MVVDTVLYDELDLEPGCSQGDVKKAYKRLSLKWHPDKPTGDEEKFKKINAAYEILSDPKKREIYDQTGIKNGEANHPFGPGSPFGASFEEIFNMFNQPTTGVRTNFRQKPTKTPNSIIQLTLKTNELYTGLKKKFNIERRIVCDMCKGTGCKKDKQQSDCELCKGKGFNITVKRIGPMTTQIQTLCGVCNGHGKVINKEDCCEMCSGKKTITRTETIEFHVEKGSKTGDKIIIRNKANEDPDCETGDIIFIIQEQFLPDFKRVGDDLYVERKILLKEALEGFYMAFEFPGGRKLMIESKSVQNPYKNVKIEDFGMPIKNTSNKYGVLHIKFHIIFPSCVKDDETIYETHTSDTVSGKNAYNIINTQGCVHKIV